MGRPKITCDYTFIPCHRHATVRFVVARRGEQVLSQYCDEHVEIMLSQPIPRGWRIKERIELHA
jgi:hypothetical protein